MLLSNVARLILITITYLVYMQVSAEEHEPEKRDASAVTADRFEVRNLEGWTIYLNRAVPQQHPEETARTLEHLRWELYQMKLAIPQAAVRNSQENNAIWIEYDEKVSLQYHPERAWLIEHGYTIPRDARSFMSLSVKTHLSDSYRHPFVVFHELAHGYDFHFIGKGRDYGNAETQENYERMLKAGTYQQVKFYDGSMVAHYACTNRMEYWSESSEAYFAVNDFYPFVRAQLREHDPDMARMVERYWGVDPQAVIKLERALAAYQAQQLNDAPQPTVIKPFIETAQYEKRNLHGWQVYVSPELVKQPGRCDAMFSLLAYKLHMIDHFIAIDGQQQLHDIPIWLEIEHEGPYIRYCGDTKPLGGVATNPDKVRAIEIRDPQRMLSWAMIEQSDVLHVLALAYYDRHVAQPESALGKRLSEAYVKAKQKDGYKNVLRFDGQRVPHPGLTSERHYFAELMESYFLVNDHYPFIRCELADLDPAGFAIIAGLWEGNPKR